MTVTPPKMFVALTVRVWFADAAFCLVVKPVSELGVTKIRGTMLTVTETFRVRVSQFTVSVGVKRMVWLPVVVGVRLGLEKVKFPGRDAPPVPVTLPPERIDEESAWPSLIALAVGRVVIVGVPLAMLKVNAPLRVPFPFVAERVALNVPAWVGVPVIAPVVELRVSPGGKAVELPKEVGELAAVMLAEKACPKVPLKVAAVMEGAVSTRVPLKVNCPESPPLPVPACSAP